MIMAPKVKVVIPFYSEFNAVKPGLKALKESGILFDVQPVQGPCVHNNRNLGINAGRSQATFQGAVEGYTHYLFIDSDISFTPAHVHVALKHKAPVVALPYLRHEDDGFYQVGELGLNYRIEKRYDKYERGFRHVSFAGAGFLLVDSAVFASLKFPWFHHSAITIGEESFSVGEDVIFSHKLVAAGIPILCDFDYPVQHRLKKFGDYDVSF
jgi:hypothetical protein